MVPTVVCTVASRWWQDAQSIAQRELPRSRASRTMAGHGVAANSSMKTDDLKKQKFEVVIPNLGDGIAERLQLDVEVFTDPQMGEEVLAPESVELIEVKGQRRRKRGEG